MNRNIPLCQADAVRKVRMIEVNGVATGINMLDEIIAEVKAMNISKDTDLRDVLLKRVRSAITSRMALKTLIPGH
ncbi:hypothetical protein [uncultured Methanospirillum sp.]|uniref:hypothetical protein n=1 Tax=uncultured Methanospirillum sp. TaxID=262503 RepID=UPI0029C6F613|nr:hypothetical protein [uncultured Methanospirillum sp.]